MLTGKEKHSSLVNAKALVLPAYGENFGKESDKQVTGRMIFVLKGQFKKLDYNEKKHYSYKLVRDYYSANWQVKIFLIFNL